MEDVFENTVRFAEIDAQGVVFYGNYVTYQDEAFTEYLEAIDYPHDQLYHADWDVRVVHVELDYADSARYRDDLINAIRVDAIGTSSIELEYECRRASDGAVLVEGGVVHVAIDEDGSTIRVPDAFREAVVEFQTVPPDPV